MGVAKPYPKMLFGITAKKEAQSRRSNQFESVEQVGQRVVATQHGAEMLHERGNRHHGETCDHYSQRGTVLEILHVSSMLLLWVYLANWQPRRFIWRTGFPAFRLGLIVLGSLVHWRNIPDRHIDSPKRSKTVKSFAIDTSSMYVLPLTHASYHAEPSTLTNLERSVALYLDRLSHTRFNVLRKSSPGRSWTMRVRPSGPDRYEVIGLPFSLFKRWCRLTITGPLPHAWNGSDNNRNPDCRMYVQEVKYRSRCNFMRFTGISSSNERRSTLFATIVGLVPTPLIRVTSSPLHALSVVPVSAAVISNRILAVWEVI